VGDGGGGQDCCGLCANMLNETLDDVMTDGRVPIGLLDLLPFHPLLYPSAVVPLPLVLPPFPSCNTAPHSLLFVLSLPLFVFSFYFPFISCSIFLLSPFAIIVHYSLLHLLLPVYFLFVLTPFQYSSICHSVYACVVLLHLFMLVFSWCFCFQLHLHPPLVILVASCFLSLFVCPFSLPVPFHVSLVYLPHLPSHFSVSGTRPTRVPVSHTRRTRVPMSHTRPHVFRYHIPGIHVYRYHIPDRHMYLYQAPDRHVYLYQAPDRYVYRYHIPVVHFS
jgi:hypothetical protein